MAKKIEKQAGMAARALVGKVGKVAVPAMGGYEAGKIVGGRKSSVEKGIAGKAALTAASFSAGKRAAGKKDVPMNKAERLGGSALKKYNIRKQREAKNLVYNQMAGELDGFIEKWSDKGLSNRIDKFIRKQESGLGVGGERRLGRPKTDAERRSSHPENEELPPRGTGLEKIGLPGRDGRKGRPSLAGRTYPASTAPGQQARQFARKQPKNLPPSGMTPTVYKGGPVAKGGPGSGKKTGGMPKPMTPKPSWKPFPADYIYGRKKGSGKSEYEKGKK